MSDSDVMSDDTSVEPENVSQPEPRRSQRIRKRPHYYIEGSSVAASLLEDPVTFQEAVTGPDSVKCKQEMEREMRSLRESEEGSLLSYCRIGKL